MENEHIQKIAEVLEMIPMHQGIISVAWPDPGIHIREELFLEMYEDYVAFDFTKEYSKLSVNIGSVEVFCLRSKKGGK